MDRGIPLALAETMCPIGWSAAASSKTVAGILDYDEKTILTVLTACLAAR